MRSGIRPLTPIFDPEKKTGSIVIGNTPSTSLPPSTLTVVGSLTDGTNLSGAWDVAIYGNYAIVATQFAGLTVVDISDPTTPTFVSNVPASSLGSSTCLGVAMYGDYAIVTCSGADRVNVVDLSTIGSPSVVGSVTDATNLNGVVGVAVSGDYAFCASYLNDRLTSVDLSTPASPSVADSVVSSTILNNAWGVAILGSHAVVTNDASVVGGARIGTVDASVPTALVDDGGWLSAELQNNWGVAIFGDYAAVTSWATSYISIIDLTDPSSPITIGTVYDATQETPYGIATYVHATGNYAIVVSDTSDKCGLLDLRTPASPSYITDITDTLLTNPIDVAISGNHAVVVSSGLNRLTMVEIS
jgi:hypothetical protein